jgi:hypothetical protein
MKASDMNLYYSELSSKGELILKEAGLSEIPAHALENI